MPGWDSFIVVSNNFDIARLQFNGGVNSTAFGSDVGDITNSWLIPIVQGLKSEFPMSEVSG